MKLHLILLSVVAAVLLIVNIGCETQSAQEKVTITPDSAGIQRSETITFTASGGYEYEWSLGEESWGILNTRRGATVQYTSLHSASNGKQIITVTSTISGAPGGGTNTADTADSAYFVKATATVIHR